MIVDNLEKRCLVRRMRDTTDRRFVTVYLTDEGRGLIGSIFPGHVSAIVEELAALNADEQDGLGTLCKKLGRRDAANSATGAP